MNAAGYRTRHAGLLEGAWIGGELLCFARNEARPAGAIQTPPDAGPGGRLLIVADVAFVRLVEIEPVHRRARVEIGVQGAFDAATARAVLAQTLAVAFDDLNLLRVYGWVRPDHEPTRAVLAAAGFAHELTVPHAMRLGGRSADREIWGARRC